MLNEEHIASKATTESITGIKWWNDRLITFTTTRPENYSFVAGQYARLGLRDENGIIWRAFSMVSAPLETATLEFYGIIVANGLFTTRLKNLRTGDPILIEKQRFGFMTPDRFKDGNDLWMLSTGTGVGPYISMLRDPYVWEHFQNLVLVHCVRHADEFAYTEELERLCREPAFGSSARLQVIRSVTREEKLPVNAPYLQGRITTLLEDGRLEQTAGLSLSVNTSRLMMCGNPEMIDDMRTLLHQRGMRPDRRATPGQYVTENYW